MALTRKMLKAMGIEDEKIEQIVDAHTETVDALKAERDKYKEDAEKLPGLQKELETLKADGGDYKAKYDKEHKAFEDYKAEITARETKAAKESAARAYFESKNITGANLGIALRGAKEEISSLELDGEKIKDTKVLDDLIAGDYAGLVVKTGAQGANTSNPPSNSGNGKKTKEEIMAIRDDRERQRAIAENHELFGY